MLDQLEQSGTPEQGSAEPSEPALRGETYVLDTFQDCEEAAA